MENKKLPRHYKQARNRTCLEKKLAHEKKATLRDRTNVV